MNSVNNSFAEIIEGSLERFTAQTWQWDNAPAFGSLLMVQDSSSKSSLLGIVHQIKTASSDSARIPFAYQKKTEDLKRDQPQIFAFLKTIFSCLVVGIIENETIVYTLAARPALIHAFVQPATAEIAQNFFSSTAYFHLLFGVHQSSICVDELLVALIKTRGTLSRTILAEFLQAYMTFISSDYRRIRLFAQRLTSFLSH